MPNVRRVFPITPSSLRDVIDGLDVYLLLLDCGGLARGVDLHHRHAM